MGKRMNFNRPKRYNGPLISEKYKAEIKRGVEILKRRVENGYKNPQAYLHGEAKIFSPDEIAEFVATRPELLALPTKHRPR